MPPVIAARRPLATAAASQAQNFGTCSRTYATSACSGGCSSLARCSPRHSGSLAGGRAAGVDCCALKPPLHPCGDEKNDAAPVARSVSWVLGGVQWCGGGRWRARAGPVQSWHCAQVAGGAGVRRASWTPARQARERTSPPAWEGRGGCVRTFRMSAFKGHACQVNSCKNAAGGSVQNIIAELPKAQTICATHQYAEQQH
jgi:hypothetical protein